MAHVEKPSETAQFGRRQTASAKRVGYPRDCLPETIANTTRDVIYVATGIIAYNAGRFKEADGCFNSALRENKKNPVAYMYKGIMHRDIGKNDEAIMMLTRSIELCGQSAQAHVERAIAYINRNSVVEAKADLRKALELVPDYAPAYLWLGGLKSMEGMHSDAIMLLEKYCELKPDDLKNRENLLRYKDAVGKIAKQASSMLCFCVFSPLQTADGATAFVARQGLITITRI